MVIVVYGLDMELELPIRLSSESRQLRFFTAEELTEIPIVITRSDIIEDWFLKSNEER